MDKKLKTTIHSFTTMTSKQGQDLQTWYESVDPMQAYNHAKFERSCLAFWSQGYLYTSNSQALAMAQQIKTN